MTVVPPAWQEVAPTREAQKRPYEGQPEAGGDKGARSRHLFSRFVGEPGILFKAGTDIV